MASPAQHRMPQAPSLNPSDSQPPVTTIHSSAEFQDVLHMNPGSLVVLMCKAQVRWAQVCWKWAKGLHDPEGLGGAHRVSGLLVLKRNVQGCRPCKMFSRKYQRMAEQFQECIFLDIVGDESTDTRRMMISNNIKVTPTFIIFRGEKSLATLTGINENNLRNAITDNMRADERDSASLE
eukprot:jgi/Astpho2/3776/fgenesh1_pg.00061_%23_1_t